MAGDFQNEQSSDYRGAQGLQRIWHLCTGNDINENDTVREATLMIEESNSFSLTAFQMTDYLVGRKKICVAHMKKEENCTAYKNFLVKSFEEEEDGRPVFIGFLCRRATSFVVEKRVGKFVKCLEKTAWVWLTNRKTEKA